MRLSQPCIAPQTHGTGNRRSVSSHFQNTIGEADFLFKSRKSRIDTLQEQVDSLVTQVALMKVLAPILCNGPTY